MLRELGIKSTGLHSYMSQSDRLSSLAKFKSQIVNILIATDVASRFFFFSFSFLNFIF